MWTVVISDEVADWYADLDDNEVAQVDRALDLLAEAGPMLRMPHVKYLGAKLYELRFRCGQVNQRITYTIREDTITLTTFRKQKQNEAREIARARKALKRFQQQEEDEK